MTRRYRIEGRVQGVGFRYFTQQQAARLGLSGWVGNLCDGAVEALASGTAAQLAEFEDELRRGPGSGLVTNLRWDENSDDVDSSGPFRIR